MSATAPRLHAVLTADVIHSRQWPRFASLRDGKLKRASVAHQRSGLVLGRYTVTTWDEFQNIASEPHDVPRLIFDLRRIFHPLQLRIGLGLGRVNQPIRVPLNQAGGEAFVLAREAVEQLKTGRGEKFERMTFVRCAAAPLQELANLFYGLHDSLVGNITEKQWRTINAHIAAPNQDVAARKLGVSKSTVSKKPAARTRMANRVVRRFHGSPDRTLVARWRATCQKLNTYVQPAAAPGFWSLLLSHFLADFPLQTESIAESKRRLLWRGYFVHGIILFALAWTCLAVFSGVAVRAPRTLAILSAFVAVHLISDWAKCAFGRLRKIERPWVFLGDQIWHLFTIAVAGAVLAQWSWSGWDTARMALRGIPPKTLPALAIYAEGAVFAGGHLVRNLTKPPLDGFSQLGAEHPGDLRPRLAVARDRQVDPDRQIDSAFP